MATKKQAAERKPLADPRVDVVGLAGEISDWIEHKEHGPKTMLKAAMAADGNARVGGLFAAKLEACTESTISASGVFKLYKRGELSEADFVGLLRIGTEAAAKVIDPKKLARLTRRWPGTPRLKVKRLADQGQPIHVLEAIENVRAYVTQLERDGRKARAA